MIEDHETIEKIQEFSKLGNIRLKKHALIRSVERNIKMDEISEALQECEIIRTYKEGKPLKSYLILGFTNQKKPLHMVVH